MKSLIWISLSCLFCLCTVGCGTNQSLSSYSHVFQEQIENYIKNCSLSYFKIRGYGKLYTTSVYEYRSKVVWDSLSTIYPDSMDFLVHIEGKEQIQRFYTGEKALASLSKRKDNRVKFIEIEVEYEIDLGCCEEKICCSYFVFDADSQLVRVRESDFYLTMPRYSRDFIMKK